MKDYYQLKNKAIQLRKRGLSYGEIREQIPAAKSTLSLWLKTVPLEPQHRKRLYTKQIEILARGPQSQKERRAREVEKIIQNAKTEIPSPLSPEAYRLMGAALYWAEGSKKNLFELSNSDPHLILFFVRWVTRVFGISEKRLKARLNIYPQQNEIKVRRFWSDLTGIPTKNFGKSYIKPLSKGYKRNNLYYGTIRIGVPRSVDMRHRVFGWIQGALQDVHTDAQLIERKWASLAKTSRPVNLKLQ
jgi:hypothetical protein